MTKEIKRTEWPKFCKKFNSDNQFRRMKVNVADKRHAGGQLVSESPFMGIVLEKKGRVIDGFQLFAGWASPEKVAQPVVSIKQPEKVVLEKDEKGCDSRLKVMTREGAEATIQLVGEKNPTPFLEKLAYSIFEKRGYKHGADMADWLEAEKKIREAEGKFI